MKTRTLIFTAAAMTALPSASAEAPGGAGVFQRFEKNGDGVLTEDELPAQAKRLMALDKNKDGLAKDEVIDALARFQGRGAQPARSGATGEAAKVVLAGPSVIKGGDVGVGGRWRI